MTHATSRPLALSRDILERLSVRTRLLAWAPLPMLLLGTAVLQYFDHRWYANVVLVAILVLFAFGQVVAFRQFRTLSRTSRHTIQALAALERLEDHPDPAAFRGCVQALAPGHVRDLVLSWLDLGERGNEGRGLHLLENARERRDILDSKLLGVHVSLNRNILKLGFLGTLVGLLLTFPPMRAAVMGLSNSGGEMKFINDIAAAIDEDAYAIQATLISMGFSLFLEALVLQLLERLLVGFQLVDSHLGDWYILGLRPWLARFSAEMGTESVSGGAASSDGAGQAEFARQEKARLEQAARDARREHERRQEDLAEFESRHGALLAGRAGAAKDRP